MEDDRAPQALSHIFRRPAGQVRLGVLTAWLLALAVLALIGTVYLAQASQAAEEGAAVESLRFRLSELQRSNAQLEADVARAQQPDRLALRAAELGYRPATVEEIEFIPVDYQPTPVPPDASAGQAESNPLSALWAQVVRALGGGP